MADQWWVVNYHLDLGTIIPGIPAGQGQHLNSVVQAPSSSAAADKVKSEIHGGNAQVVIDGVQGPYKTEAEAKSAQAPQQVGGNPLDPTAALQELSHFVGVLVTALTDVAMWRSLGWILLGGIMLLSGVYLWLKDKNLLPEGMPIPVPV